MKNSAATKIIILSVLLALTFSMAGLTPARADTTTISENFDSALSGWTLLGSTTQYDGWLRLTSAAKNVTGAAFYTTAYTTSGNVFDIRFEYATYNDSFVSLPGADGLAFFMLDGSVTPTATGAGGSGLGYTGISGGYFGVGLDEYGGFGGQSVGTDNVAIRGETTGGNPLLISVPTTIQTEGRYDKKSVRITFYNKQVSFWVNGVLLISEQTVSSNLPATVKFGFSGATGDSLTNKHEVDNLTVTVRPTEIIRATTAGGTTWPCGDTWANACSLQTALANAVGGDEIWVAGGTYKPTTGSHQRAATFQLAPGVAVYGGFDGTEDDRSQRDWAANAAILSGDLLGNDSGFTNNDENNYHVVTGANGATLDGFTITAGNANGGSLDDGGGGMYNSGVSPTVANVTFSSNSAAFYGGGMFNQFYSPTVTNVTFSGNSVSYYGGGMYNGYSNPTLTNVTFSGNSASYCYGGGMYNGHSNPTLKNVIVANSTSGGDCRLDVSTLNAASANNLIEATGANACDLTNGVNGNIIGSDPLLGALGSYGGSTQTFPLLPGSAAIDAGDSAACAAAPVSGKDQRGQDRDDYQCDIGAFELKYADGPTVSKAIPGAGSYTFGPTLVKVAVTDTGGCLTGITVQRSNVDHPNADDPLKTGHWWHVAASPSGCTGFDVSLTLPTDFMPDGTGKDEVCRYLDPGWDCAWSSSAAYSLTRDHVTGFSDWTVGHDAGPTAVVVRDFRAQALTPFPLSHAQAWERGKGVVR